MSSIRKKAAVVGAYEFPLRRAPQYNPFQIQAVCARAALGDAGLSTRDVDGVFVLGGAGGGLGAMGPATMAEYLGISPSYMDGQAIGGASFVSQVGHAAAAIAAGMCNVALITYGSTSLSDARKTGTSGQAIDDTPPMHFETPYGKTLIACYAMHAQRHAHDFGSTAAQRAEISVATRKWAQLNKDAMFREPLTVEDVLNSRMIASPLRFFECCIISDGGGAVVVTSAEQARDLKQKPIYVLGAGEATGYSAAVSQVPDFSELTQAKLAGQRAFNMAGVKVEDIDVAELYDAFTINVILTLEALGVCPKGEGGNFVSGQRTAPGGSFPVNTDGGGLSSCHPGARGIFLVIEATRQLRGGLGPRQVPNAKLALVHGIGGFLSCYATLILSNE